MVTRRGLLFVACVAGLGGCGGSPTPEPTPTMTLGFAAFPGSVPQGEPVPAFQVRVFADGILDTAATNVVTLTLGASSPAGTLTGITTRPAVAGVATFDDLAVVGGFGSGFTLDASSPGFAPVASPPFTVVQDPSAKLVITSVVPAALAPFEGFDVTVEVRTAGDVLQESATNVVTLALSGGGPDLFWHASGNAPRVVEMVDHAAAAILRTLPSSVSGEVDGAIYDTTTQLLDVTTTSGALFIAEPATGDEARWADANTLSGGLKGLVFDDAGVLHAGNGPNANHYTVDLASGVNTLVGTFAMPGFALTGNNGLAKDPLTGVIYGVAKVSVGPRRLATLDLATATFTDVGSLGDNFSFLTYDPAGTLFGCTGDGATVPETLYQVDEATAAKTLVMTMGNGGSGEVVVFVPRRLGGLVSASAVGGTVTFHGLYIDQPGTDYAIGATSPGLTPGEATGYAVSGAVVPTSTVEFQTPASLVAEDVPGGNAQVTLTLAAPQPHAIPVFLTIDTTSTATAGGATPDTTMRRAFQVLFPAGQTTVTFDVPVVDDADAEPDETLVMTIRSANLAAGIGATATHTLTIQSNE